MKPCETSTHPRAFPTSPLWDECLGSSHSAWKCCGQESRDQEESITGKLSSASMLVMLSELRASSLYPTISVL